MDSFDLYREAMNDYERLIPDKQSGLVLLSLYSKFEDKEFQEEDIIYSIKNVLQSFGKSIERTEYEKNNKLILYFQDKFLWRDSLSKKYRFKPYGLQYCKHIHQRLKDDYNPAKIKREFDELLIQLKNLITQDEINGFNQWVDDHFDIRKLNLSRQIESLDEQVNRSVEEFKKEMKKDLAQTDIISMLNGMDDRLDEIKGQVDEMTQAFSATYEIDELLQNLRQHSLEKSFDIKNAEMISTVSRFNKQVRSNLEYISNRIEKLKPRIRDFFTGFNRLDFDRKSVKFLEFLLQNSMPINESGKKSLIPPKSVPLVTTTISDICPQFLIIPQRDIGIKRPTEVTTTSVDESKKTKFLNRTKASLYEKQRVKYWVKRAFDIIEKDEWLNFSHFFFEILISEHKKLSIAVCTAQQVLKLSRNREDLKVMVEPIKLNNEYVENIEIWKINIQKTSIA